MREPGDESPTWYYFGSRDGRDGFSAVARVPGKAERYVLVGYQQVGSSVRDTRLFVVQLDAHGDEQWAYLHEASNASVGRDVVSLTSDQGEINHFIVGTLKRSGGIETTIVIKLDDDGDLVDQVDLRAELARDAEGYPATLDTDGHPVDAAGDLLDEVTLVDSLRTTPTRLIATEDGDLLLIGEADDYPEECDEERSNRWQLYAAKFSRSLRLRWNRVHGQPWSDHFGDAVEVDDGFILVGTTGLGGTTESGAQTSEDPTLLKLSADGKAVQWTRRIGSAESLDRGRAIVPLGDRPRSRFLVAGYTSFFRGLTGGSETNNAALVFVVDDEGQSLRFDGAQRYPQHP
jgi:hypothetical protein